MDGSRELIEDLKRRGHKVVLASSAKQDEVEHYLDQLDARELADALDDIRRRRGDQAAARSGPGRARANRRRFRRSRDGR